MSVEIKKTILLVEDEAIIALIEKKSLEKYGYKVIISNSGKKAFDVFRKNKAIDIILMDIELGHGLTGPETAEMMLKEREIPIVFLTGYVEPEAVDKIDKITTYGYVVKNSGITILDASLKMALKLFDAKKQIVESNIKQKAMMSNISDVIEIIDADGVVKFKSPNLEKWFGWLPEDFTDTGFWFTVHPDDLERIREEFFYILKKDNVSKMMEFRYRCKDGSYKDVELTATNLLNEPIINGILLNFHDITKRKLADVALRESNAYLESLINYANAPIIVWDPQFRITRFNHAFELLTGMSEAEVLGQSLDILFPPVYSDSSMALIRSTQTGERWDAVEINIQHVDGSVRTVLWNSASLFSPDGENISATIAQGRDITARKKVENALRESNAYLENLINYANAPIIVWDPQFCITRFNHAFEFLTGMSEAEVLGRSLDILFPPEYADRSMVLIRSTQTGERWEAVEINIQHVDGSVRTLLWNSASLFSPNGKKLVATIAQGQDITKRKNAEGEVIRLNLSILNFQEEERQRIAKDLHDSVGQTILAAKMSIDTYKQDPHRFESRLDVGTDFLAKASQELRDICMYLYPTILTDLGLERTITRLAANIMEPTGIQSNICINLKSRLPHEIEVNLYRIIQELFSNILKHSFADVYDLYLYSDESIVKLLVKDNGKGIQSHNGGYMVTGSGIANIKNRISQFNGNVLIEENKPRGTLVSIWFDL